MLERTSEVEDPNHLSKGIEAMEGWVQGRAMEAYEIMPNVSITNDLCLLVGNSTVVVADLHIGYESALESDGIHIPRIQTASIKKSLHRIIEQHEPRRMIILGDMKHEFSRNLVQEMRDIRQVLSILKEHTELILVKGNHDNYLENIACPLGIDVTDKYEEGGFTFVHGHQDCSDRPLIMAHEHPSIKIVDKVGAYLKLPCFLKLQEQIIVMPPFSPLASGTDLTGVIASDYLSPILRKADVDRAEVFACSEIGILNLGNLAKIEELRF